MITKLNKAVFYESSINQTLLLVIPWTHCRFSRGVTENRIGAKRFSEIKLTVVFYPRAAPLSPKVTQKNFPQLFKNDVQLLIIKVDFESGLEEIANLLRRSTRRLHLPESTRKVRGECHFSYRYESPKKS